MSAVTLTGVPNCNYCVMLEKIVSDLSVPFTKVDLTENDDIREIVTKDGNRSPACIIAGEDMYIVKPGTPAMVGPVSGWLKGKGLL